MVRVENVSKTFKTRKKTVKALDNVSFEVQDGECFGLIGANGAGKTTLMRIMAGLIQADSGCATFDGLPNGATMKVARQSKKYNLLQFPIHI